MEHRAFIPVTRMLAMLGDWAARGPDPAVDPQGAAKYRVLAGAIADRIHEGEAAAGLRLPSERELARRLGVSRGTVVAAYELLEEQRLVERRRGSGTWIRPIVAPAAPADRRHGLWSLYRGDGDADVADLSIGAPREIPDLVLEGLRWAGEQLQGMHDHGYHAGGVPVARRAIADRYARIGIPTEPEQIVVTGGAQSAISLLGRLFLHQHAPVAIEVPAYPGAIEALQRAGGTLVAVDRDVDGPRPESLASALAARPTPLVYLVPDAHNPTGDVISLTRRRRLVAVAAEHDTLLVEDATLTQLTYAPPPPSLLELAPAGRVIQVGSASKELWGGLRVGWIRTEDRHLADRLARLQAAESFGIDVVSQLAVAWALPRAGQVVARRRIELSERMTLLRELVAEELPEWEAHAPRGGGSLWVRLPSESADVLLAHARRLGVTFVPGTASAIGNRYGDRIRLTAWGAADELREGVRRLALAWREVVDGVPADPTPIPRPSAGTPPDAVAP